MSRYAFNDGKQDIVVGWDNPTQTLFADVDDIRSTMLDMGRFDICNVEELEEVANISIPEDIKAKLEHDRDTAPAPTPLQAAMGQLFRR